jgi:hypothetical protein
VLGDPSLGDQVEAARSMDEGPALELLRELSASGVEVARTEQGDGPCGRCASHGHDLNPR